VSKHRFAAVPAANILHFSFSDTLDKTPRAWQTMQNGYVGISETVLANGALPRD